MLQFNRISQMENKSLASSLSPSRSQNILKKYHQLTSPLVSLQSARKQNLMKDELRQNVSMKLDCIKNRGSKIYALDSTISYSDLKAGAVLYQIPQFSTPQVNFEVSDQIRKRVEEARKEIINYFPEISRSSNYAPKKIEHQLNHRSAVRQLEEWLNDKLKNPPVNSEESIEYKNMIMGVGMKELIRIIGKRCSEQGRMAEEIWELTWSICREIILYLSKRAKKCEQLLEEELSFMRVSYEKEYERLNAENSEFSKKIDNLEEQNKEFLSELVKLRKRRQSLEDENKELTFNNFHLQNEFKKVLEENLAIYLQIGDKNKRGWIKKMYKNISCLPEQTEATVKSLFKKEVADVIEERVKLEEITGDCDDPINAQQVEAIGNRIVQKQSKKKHKNKAKKAKRISKVNKYNDDATLITTLENVEEDNNYLEEMSDDSCADMIQNMREEFLPVDAAMQTDAKQLIDAYASTYRHEFADQSFGVSSHLLGFLEEMGVNTEEIKEEPAKGIKKKGKENTKEDTRKQKSKIYNVPPLKEKVKPKVEKDKKSILDIVQQLNHHEESKVEEKDESFSVSNEILIMDNNSLVVGDSKTDLTNQVQIRSFQKKNSVMVSQEHPQPTIKTNSVILSPSLTIEIRQKMAVSGAQPSKKEKSDSLLRNLEENLSPGYNLFKNMDKDSSNYMNSDSSRNEKQVHSISFDTGINKIKEAETRASKLSAINECSIYICAECNKIITAFDEKFQLNKHVKEILEEKRLAKISPNESLRRILPQDEGDEDGMDKRSGGMRRVRKEVRKNSSYIHDIAFKKDMQEQQNQQQQQQVFKNSPYTTSKDQTYEKYQENYETQAPVSVYNKISPYLLFFTQLVQSNKPFIQGLVTSPMQIAENLEHYFEMVRQINALSQSKINISEKSTITIIEKNVFPILNELLVTVKKSVKTNHISQVMKNFTSLPNIVYNRITRKYGVKILAIKNLKILLMALKCAGKYTDKYKIIELMLFTDCKSPHSEDLFMYLFIMALYDPTFSSNRVINYEQTQTVRKICEDYLTKEPIVYQQFDKIGKQVTIKQQESILLSSLVKSIITNYRLLKINRIEEVGFVYLMLKKDHHMTYKKFIYFLATLNIPHNKKLRIAKKLLQFCDIKSKDQRIGISEIMFSKFLMNCPEFNFVFLEEIVNSQLEHYKSEDKGIVDLLSTKFFKSQKQIKSNYYFQPKVEGNRSSQQQGVRQSISIVELSDVTILNPNNESSIIQTQGTQRAVENITVLKQIKEYSSFTYHICRYLESIEQTKFLNFKQHLFIKNYLIVHIIEAEIEKTVGLLDYFSNSMLQTISMPLQDFSLASSKRH